MEDPISSREYDPTPEGFHQWVAQEVPYGLPLVYALVGGAVVGVLTAGIITGAGVLLSAGAPAWAYMLVPVVAVFWGYGGWLCGQQAAERQPREPSIAELNE